MGLPSDLLDIIIPSIRIAWHSLQPNFSNYINEEKSIHELWSVELDKYLPDFCIETPTIAIDLTGIRHTKFLFLIMGLIKLTIDKWILIIIEINVFLTAQTANL